MGTWGIGTFENDDASDWVYELEPANDLSVVQAALATLNDATGYREAPTCVNALAAAEVVAALLGKPSPDLPEAVVGWVSANARLPARDLRTNALTAIDKILGDSELRELWGETDDAEAWQASVQELRARLTS